jgi:putative ABC transport system permease protein
MHCNCGTDLATCADMIKNYLLITFRNFLRNRNYTLINILGLSIGLTACIVIFLLIRFDTEFDQFHNQYSRIYRVVRTTSSASGIEHSSVTPYPFAGAFRQDFTDVPLVTQLHYHDQAFATIGTDKKRIDRIVFADSVFFKVFDFGVKSGNPAEELGQPNKAFLTESLAAKLNLGVGGRMKLDNVLDLEVVGILEDVPPSSHIQYTMIVSMPSFTKKFFSWGTTHWGLNSAGFSYLVLPENMTPDKIVSRFPGFIKKYYDKDDAENNAYLLQPLREIHFDTEYSGTPGHIANIDTSNLQVLGLVGFFILAIASINFVNLATALAIKKSKEIGVRKTLGARRSQLTIYFLLETLILTVIAVIISLGLVEWLLPWLRNFTEKEIYLRLFTDPVLSGFLLGLIAVTTLLSGLYPGLILAGFDPIAVLKNRITGQGTSGSFVRRALVITQFVIAQVLIIGMLVVSNQMDYFNSKPLGFSHEAIVTVPLPKNDKAILENLRTRLESNPKIKNVTFALGAPTSDANMSTGYFLPERGESEHHPVQIKCVDRHYKDLYGFQMIAGRWFTESDEMKARDTTLNSESRYALIVNEAAVEKLGFTAEEALDKRVHVGVNDITAPIVGVTNNFHTSSLRYEIEPVIMLVIPDLYFGAGMSIASDDIPATIAHIRKTWEGLYPDYFFDYNFLDEHLAGLYRNEKRQLVLFRIFSGVSIFIGCLGLLGLVSFMANQKLKEIGVRKVFGASIPTIVKIFSKEFVLLVVVAFVIAAPLSRLVMQYWLENFEYHVNIHWSVYAVGLFTTLFIALATIAYRATRAAMANPIESLRAD